MSYKELQKWQTIHTHIDHDDTHWHIEWSTMTTSGHYGSFVVLVTTFPYLAFSKDAWIKFWTYNADTIGHSHIYPFLLGKDLESGQIKPNDKS